MGIRYYAYPIQAEQYGEALEDPCRFHGSDPLRLIQGSVTHTDTGWIAHEAALSPTEVRDIAADLATVDEADIRRALPQAEDGYDYVLHFLAAAKDFTARIASEGRGLVYLIG